MFLLHLPHTILETTGNLTVTDGGSNQSQLSPTSLTVGDLQWLLWLVVLLDIFWNCWSKVKV